MVWGRCPFQDRLMIKPVKVSIRGWQMDCRAKQDCQEMVGYPRSRCRPSQEKGVALRDTAVLGVVFLEGLGGKP